MAENDNYSIGSSIFFILILLMSLGGLFFMMIKAYSLNNLKFLIIAVIFSIAILGGAILAIMTGKYKVLTYTPFGIASLSFLSGFIIWLFIGAASSKSVLSFASLESNALFTSISGELPGVVQFIMEGIIIPFAEEMFWMVGLTAVLLVLMKLLSKKYKIFNNPITQITVLILVGGITFAMFHVQKTLLAFIISAIIFRAGLYIIVIGDALFDWWKYGAISLAFAFGAHMGNNWGNIGFLGGISLLSEEPIVGWIVLAFFLVLIGASVDYLVTKYGGNPK